MLGQIGAGRSQHLSPRGCGSVSILREPHTPSLPATLLQLFVWKNLPKKQQVNGASGCRVLVCLLCMQLRLSQGAAIKCLILDMQCLFLAANVKHGSNLLRPWCHRAARGAGSSARAGREMRMRTLQRRVRDSQFVASRVFFACR